jgi:heat shock protein HslJ
MYKYKNISIILLLLLVSVIFTSACINRQAGADLIDITWRWASLVENEPASQSVVADPENYTIILNSDGTMNIKADCNVVSGTYVIDGKSLTLELGPSTLAFCGEESLDGMFNEMLTKVESFSLENDQLTLNLENEFGRMSFIK